MIRFPLQLPVAGFQNNWMAEKNCHLAGWNRTCEFGFRDEVGRPIYARHPLRGISNGNINRIEESRVIGREVELITVSHANHVVHMQRMTCQFKMDVQIFPDLSVFRGWPGIEFKLRLGV